MSILEAITRMFIRDRPKFCVLCGKELLSRKQLGDYDPYTGESTAVYEHLYCPYSDHVGHTSQTYKNGYRQEAHD